MGGGVPEDVLNQYREELTDLQREIRLLTGTPTGDLQRGDSSGGRNSHADTEVIDYALGVVSIRRDGDER